MFAAAANPEDYPDPPGFAIFAGLIVPLCLERLHTLSDLRQFRLEDTKVTDGRIEELKKVLPDLYAYR